MIQRIIVSLTILFGILMLLLPKTDDASMAMIASGAMLKCSMDFRNQVTQQLLKQEAVTAKFNNTCSDLIAAVEVKLSGEMVITGSKHALMMTLAPVVEKGKVLWSCHGEPAAMITKLCKPLPVAPAQETVKASTQEIPPLATDNVTESEQPVIEEQQVLSDESSVVPDQQ